MAFSLHYTLSMMHIVFEYLAHVSLQIIPQLLTLLLLEQIPTFPVSSSSFGHHVPSGGAMAALYRSTPASGQGEQGGQKITQQICHLNTSRDVGD